MEELLRRLALETGFSGAALVRVGDRKWELARGEAHKGFHVPNAVDTRFDCASVTKLFTAAAVLRLADEGKLSLAAPIRSLVDLEGTKIPTDVTLLHLLTHTSGIADDADEEAGEDYADLFRDSPNYALRECRDFLKNFAWKEPNFPAGTDMRYCNCSFILLGLAVEAVAGMSYRDYVRKAVFEPAGMRDAAFLAMDEANERMAEGYIGGGMRKNIYSYPPVGTPDGGACVTVGDLDAFVDAACTGKLFSPGMTTYFCEPHSEPYRPFPWHGMPDAIRRIGCAFEFVQREGKTLYMFKEGVNAGVSAMVSYHPAQGAVIALLSNAESDVWRMHDALRDHIHGLPA